MSESTSTDVFVDDPEFTFPTERAGETFVRTLRDSNGGFCHWCLAPLRPNPTVKFPGEDDGEPITTAATFDKFGIPIDDVPPNKVDEQGVVVEYSRDEQTICGNCGEVDAKPGVSRSKETTRHALRHLCSILRENETAINLLVADETVTEAFADGRTGQFCQVLGEAIYCASDD